MLALLAVLPAFDMHRHAGRELSDLDASCGEFLSYDPNDPDAPVPSNFCQSSSSRRLQACTARASPRTAHTA